ncbi:MAG: homoserine kinase [Dehalococcoidia bacterium]|nr:homoserine kinase [Dehalococcoidia bacterium]
MNLLERSEVRVPATTANLGPGFDCLGMALDLWNTVTLERGREGVTITGEGADRIRRDQGNLVLRAVSAVFQRLGQEKPPLALACHNVIPMSRGLGSSSAAIVGGLVAGNALCGSPLTEQDLLNLATEQEGHPDNVTPALLGGCQIAVQEGGKVVASRVPLPPGLSAVLFIPTMPMPTAKARAVLEPTVAREDAVYNIGRAALLVNAFATRRLDVLDVATNDRLHQPQRERIFPQMRLLFRAARQAGALGVFLSGAGSTVLALTVGREMTIAYEMAEEARKASLEGSVVITKPTEQGAQIVSVE